MVDDSSWTILKCLQALGFDLVRLSCDHIDWNAEIAGLLQLPGLLKLYDENP